MSSTATRTSRGSVLLSERDGPVLTLTLNRPDASNAIDNMLRDELARAGESVPLRLRSDALRWSGELASHAGDLDAVGRVRFRFHAFDPNARSVEPRAAAEGRGGAPRRGRLTLDSRSASSLA